MNVQELGNFLVENNIPQEEVNKLMEEEIDEEAFKDLNIHDLNNMNIRIGPKKKLEALIKKLNLSEEVLVVGSPISANASVLDTSQTSCIIVDPSITPNTSPSVLNSSTKTNIIVDPSTSKWTNCRNLNYLFSKSSAGRQVLQSYKAETITDSDLNNITKIVVDELVSLCSNYPSTAEKTACAESIILTFPALALKNQSSAVASHALWFCANGSKNSKRPAGKIEYRLERLRLKLSPSKKKNVVRKITKLVPPQDALDLIKELRDIRGTKPNYEKVVILFQKTFVDRCVLRKSGITGSQMLQKYQKLVEYSGALFHVEFRLMKLTDLDLNAELEKILPLKDNFFKEIEDEFLQCLASIKYWLPARGVKRPRENKDSEDPHTTLKLNILKPIMKWMPVEDDLDDFISLHIGSSPYILIKSSTDFKNGVCFAVIDEVYIQTNTSKEAFSLVYTAHYVMNLKYDAGANVFYNFFDTLFKIKNVNALQAVRKILDSKIYS